MSEIFNYEKVIKIIKSEDIRSYILEIVDAYIKDKSFLLHDVEKAEKEELSDAKIFEFRHKIKELEDEKERYAKELQYEREQYAKVIQDKLSIENELNLYKEKVENLLAELETQKNILEEERKLKVIIQEKLEDYIKKYTLIDTAIFHYMNLSEEIKQRMYNIFSNINPYNFVVAVSKWNNIEGLYEFTKRRIIEEDNNGIKELVSLFESSFNIFCSIEGGEKYKLMKPEVGEHFDSDKHSIKGIKTDGLIEEVLLSGIYDSAIEKTIFKALVTLK